jgi:4'-phosphopantetheinyl transferase
MRILLRDPATAPGAKIPETDVVHVWQFRLESAQLDLLTDEERVRAARYRLERPREQFVAARGMMRMLLGRYLGCPPRDVPLTVEPGGKPILDSAAIPGLHFNLTHSGEVGLFAAARQRVGVDVEELRGMPNAEGLVERFFATRERQTFAGLPEELRVAGFFRGWTCKEALLKAVGRGLVDLESCVVELDPRQEPRVIGFDAGVWRVLTWVPRAGYAAAVAVESAEQLGLENETGP